MQFMKKGAALMLALVMLLSACATSTAVAKVDGKEITREEFDYEYGMNEKLYTLQYGEEFLKSPGPTGRTMETELKDQVLGLMIIYRLMEADLAKNDVTITPEEEEQAIVDSKTTVGSEEDYKKFLEDTGFSDEEFAKYSKQNLLYKKHLDMYTAQADITDEKIKEYYEANHQAYDTVTASHILVETEEEAKAVKARLDAGEDFAAVAKEVSTDVGSAENGGDLGEFTHQTMVPEFSEAAFALEPGQVSDPVQSQFGFHIIKVSDRKGDLEMFKDQIRQTLATEGHGNYLKELELKAKVERLIDFDAEAAKTEAATEALTEPAGTEAPQVTEPAASEGTEATE